ncbi:ATPase, T2SS/T4P/T4SS family [Oerskovia sp. M15]
MLRSRAFTLDELVHAGGLPAVGAGAAPLVTTRANMLVSGGTGTGKTTLLAALLSLVPSHERIVCVEEARELVPDHPHVVPSRPAARTSRSGRRGPRGPRPQRAAHAP